MTIFVDEILKGKFDFSRDVFKIEEKLSNDPNSFDDGHLSAYRICRRPAMIVWTEELYCCNEISSRNVSLNIANVNYRILVFN
ncbi:MAG: hypothetical protein ACHQ1D_03790 [Nitrososphaerales archaeon]